MVSFNRTQPRPHYDRKILIQKQQPTNEPLAEIPHPIIKSSSRGYNTRSAYSPILRTSNLPSDNASSSNFYSPPPPQNALAHLYTTHAHARVRKISIYTGGRPSVRSSIYTRTRRIQNLLSLSLTQKRQRQKKPRENERLVSLAHTHTDTSSELVGIIGRARARLM